jgi:hypothetical protein
MTSDFPGELEAGTARVDITPEVGSELSGYIFPPRFSEGVRDPLYATAAILRCRGEGLVLVSCDLIALGREVCDLAKESIANRCGMGPERVMISCTHIHTGPNTGSIFSSRADDEYLAGIPAAISDAVADAYARLSPALISAATGREETLGFNRRYLMRDGRVETNPGIGNPQVLRPVAGIDPGMLAIVLTRRDGGVMGCILNYSNHVDVLGGNLISSDYPGSVARMFRTRFGDRSNLVYLNGACGDVNHIDIHGPRKQGGPEKSEQMAKVLFSRLTEIMGRTRPLASNILDGGIEEVVLPRRKLTDKTIADARRALDGSEEESVDTVLAREVLAVAARDQRIRTLVQCLRLSDIGLFGLPGEAFVDIALEIKEKSPFAHNAVVELANDYMGYLPTDRAFDQGGYEVRPARSSQVGPGTQGILVDAALKLAARMSLDSEGDRH